MSKTSMAILLVPALLGLAGFTALSNRSPQRAACEIRMTRTSLGMKIDGVVHGRAGGWGSYQLELEKSGPSGRSDVAQDGDFTIPNGGRTIVSESELNVSRGDVYRVVMTTSTGAHCEAR